MKNDNVGKCGHAKCAGGELCYQKGRGMRTYEDIKNELAIDARNVDETEKCERCGEKVFVGATCTYCGY